MGGGGRGLIANGKKRKEKDRQPGEDRGGKVARGKEEEGGKERL